MLDIWDEEEVTQDHNSCEWKKEKKKSREKAMKKKREYSSASVSVQLWCFDCTELKKVCVVCEESQSWVHDQKID